MHTFSALQANIEHHLYIVDPSVRLQLMITFRYYLCLAVAISLVLVIASLPMKERIWAQQRGLILPEPTDQPAPTNNTNSTSGISNMTVKSEQGNSNTTLDDQDKDNEVSKSSSNLTETDTQDDGSSDKQSQDDGNSEPIS
jgi:hypothetical protein